MGVEPPARGTWHGGLSARARSNQLACHTGTERKGLAGARWEVRTWCPDWGVCAPTGTRDYATEATGRSIRMYTPWVSFSTKPSRS